MEINGYELSRDFFDYSFANPDTITPNHIALYFFCIEHCNRLGWKEKFSLPTTMVMEGICIRSYKTYIKTFNDLIQMGFIKLIQKSSNQYSANVISLVKNNKTRIKSLDNAISKHVTKKVEKNENNSDISLCKKDQSTIQSTIQSIDQSTIESTDILNDSINKPITINLEQQLAEEKKVVGDVVSKNLKTATNFKELPDHIRELCENLIKNNFRFSKVTDEILELGIITFHNEEEYLKRRGFTTRIPDVFYYAPNGYKYHSLLDILFFLMSDDVSKNQIKMTTGLQDDKLITDWVLTYAKHVFTENKGLIISEMRNHIKRCWTSKPGIDFQAKLYAPKYNQLPKNENQR